MRSVSMIRTSFKILWKQNFVMHKIKSTPLQASTTILVPYLKEHVEIYNNWMQDPELLLLTDSEPLTLDQEYEMQVSWALDPLKYTFIITSQTFPNNKTASFPSSGMIGDINLFLDQETGEVYCNFYKGLCNDC